MENDEIQSAKCKAFVAELDAICRKHGVYLTVSGYDFLEVWDEDDNNSSVADRIEDCTKQK